MSSNCDVILKWGATPEELRAVGGALWRWCVRERADVGIYRYLNNQLLADLIAGRLPQSKQTDASGVHVRSVDSASSSREATIERLRRDILNSGIEDITIDGTSWNEQDSTNKLATPFAPGRGQEIDDRRAETAPRPSFASCEFNHNRE